jgi:16S rRNA (cytosine967-C5)-methyltransferase
MLRSTALESSPRAQALYILIRVDAEGAFADQLLASSVAGHSLSPQARALLHELTYGVLRWRNRLDWMLEQCSQRPLATLAPPVRNLLRLGAYQLCWMDRTPAYAAVWETVQLAKRVGHGGIVAFVNAVLRALARRWPSLPLPDRTTDPESYLTIALSHPRWLVQRWLGRFGLERTEAVCEANNTLPPLTGRVNRLRTTRAELLEAFRGAGCEAEPCRFAPDGIRIRSHPPFDRFPLLAEGQFYIQDEAALLCGYLLDPQAGERVLDACAAPGGKATHLAELMGDRGEVVALDQSPHRLRLVEDNCRRLGLRSVRCLAGDAAAVELSGSFDRIFVDAPCSGLGVIRRHPDARWRKGPELIAAMQGLQQAILEHVSRFLKPEGVLVYATCSTESEENEETLRSFCRRHPNYRLEPAAAYLPEPARMFAHPEGWFQTWPGPEGLDGFFAARLRRAS